MDALGTCKAPPLPPQLRRRHRRPGRSYIESADPRTCRRDDEMAADYRAPGLNPAHADAVGAPRTCKTSPPPRQLHWRPRRSDRPCSETTRTTEIGGCAIRATRRWRTLVSHDCNPPLRTSWTRSERARPATSTFDPDLRPRPSTSTLDLDLRPRPSTSTLDLDPRPRPSISP